MINEIAQMTTAFDTCYSYNLQRVASLSSQIALFDIKPSFRVNLDDWQAMAVLDFSVSHCSICWLIVQAYRKVK
ncbi:hypothetical protein J3456_16535 [Sulfitobacter sp. NFXS29]|uniref:hypothetical protein n=1 Tax=Sulfitobacter sp. NFXS29 TaxID=2818438 RepID=UPI0032DF485A